MWKQWSEPYPHPMIFSGFISLVIPSFINRVVTHLAPGERIVVPPMHASCSQITRLSTRKALGIIQEVW